MQINLLKKLLLVTAWAFLILPRVNAQFEEGRKDASLIGVVTGPNATNAVDSVIINPTQGESSKKIQNIIWFKINELADTGSALLYIKSGFTAKVTLKVDLWLSAASGGGAPNQTLTPTTPLTVTYNPAGGTQYNPIAYWVLSGTTGYEKVRVDITSITITGLTNGWTASNVLPLLTVENEMRVLRYFNSPSLPAPSPITQTYDAAKHADQLSVSWAFPVTGQANSTQLEYAWVENETQPYYFVNGTFNTNKLFQLNSTRVDIDTSNEIFNIPLLYDADPAQGGGKLYYRVRSVLRRNNGTVVTGAWSAVQTFAYNGHQPNLNWQSTTNFAENGKTNTVAQYFDGSLRERQTVTKDNSTGNTTVAETIYDLQGRPAVQILPTPTISTAIQYYADFNRFSGQTTIDDPAKYFDLSLPGMQCSSAPKLDTTHGNGLYYSQKNPWIGIDSNAKFIPDANGYAFIETRYTDDPTQRISVQGGPGQAHQIGNGHETKYYYGKPSQNELDALFGTEVGDASHYFKNMVQDANGQMSVSYVDMHGRTIATALAGAAPGKLLSINNNPNFYPVAPGVLTNNLLTPATNIIKGDSIQSISTILVPATTIDTFHYQLVPAILQQLNCNKQQICFDCKYNLEISIRREDCSDTAPILMEYNNLQIVPANQACGTPMGFIGTNITIPTTQISFPVTLAPGSYVVRKTLVINDSMFKVREDSALAAFLCKTQQILSDSIFASLSTVSGCNIPPGTNSCNSCQGLLGSSYSTSNYKANFIASLGGKTNMTDAAIHALYTQDSLACADACGLSLNPSFSTLVGLRSLMLTDMIPFSGQYAISTDSVGSTSRLEARYNIFTTSYTDTGHFGGYTGVKPYYKNPVTEPGDVSTFYAASDGSVDNTIYPNGNSANTSFLNNVLVDNFATIFNRSWAGQLLYYHPEYSKLHFAETTLQSSFSWQDNVLQCNSYALASSKGYLNPLSSDPFFTAGYVPANTTSMQGYLTSNIPNSSNNLSIWRIANGQALCDTSLPLSAREACIYNKSPTGIDPSATTTAQKDAVWQAFRANYLGFRNEMVMAYINSQTGGISSGAMAELQREGKQLRFANAHSIAGQNGWTWWDQATYLPHVDSVALADSANAYVARQTTDSCAAQRPFWQARLMQCEQLQQFLLNQTHSDSVKVTAIINAILDSMVMVCHNSIDANDPSGASNVNPAKLPVVPSNFENIINHVFNQYHIANLAGNYFCNPYTIDYPKPYNSNPPLFVNVSGTIDSCNCIQFAALKTSAQAAGFNPASFSSMNSYFLANYNDTLSLPLWQGLQQCSTATLSTGLIAYWPLSNTGADLSGNNHNGTLINVSPTLDRFGTANNAMLFNGRSSLVTVSDAAPLRLNNTDYSITAWVRLDSFNTGLNSSILSRRGAIGPGNGYIFVISGVDSLNSGGVGPTIGGNIAYNNGTNSYQWPTAPVILGRWHMVTAVYSLSTQTLTEYLDTSVAGTFTGVATPPATAFPITIGYDSAAAQNHSGGYYFKGAMSDIRLYGRMLTPVDIQQLENLNTGTIAHWPLNNTGNDVSGNNHGGTLSNLTATADHLGIANNAVLFNGTTSVVTVNDATPLHLNNTDYTISAWVRLDAYNTGLNSSILSRRGAIGAGAGYIMAISGQGSAPAGNTTYSNGTSGYAFSSPLVTPGQWHLMTVTYSLSAQTLTEYFDGTAYKTYTGVATPPNTSFSLKIGYDSAAYINGYVGYYFQGAMSDVRLYNRVLSTGEVQQLSGLFQPIKIGSAVIIPPFLNCGYVKPCMSCAALKAYTDSFHALYPAYAGVPYTNGGAATDTGMAKQNALWARYINYKTGFSKTANEYAAAFLNCGLNPGAVNLILTDRNAQPPSGSASPFQYNADSSIRFATGYASLPGDNFTTLLTPTLTGAGSGTALCALDKPVTYVAMPDTTHKNPCQQVQDQADFMAQVIIAQQHDSLIANFDSLYRAKCFTAQSNEVFYATYRPSEYHYTLYYYDQAGNLVKTMPPAAVKPNYSATYLAQVQTARAVGSFQNNGTNIENMATQYRYSALNVVIAEKSPDGGISHFWYDRLDRLAISQNANQAISVSYGYTLFDSLGRVTEAGQKPQSTAMTQTISQDTAALRSWLANLTNGGVKQQITRTVYDAAYPAFTGTAPITQLNLRNRVSYTEVIDADNTNSPPYRAATFYSYDIHGNADTLLQDYGTASVMGVNANRFKLIKYDYDLVSGKVNLVSYQAGQADAFYHRYQYDAENRLTSVKTSRDSILWQNDATYFYYRHGQLARTQLGDLQVQGVDYAYTLQGWMKHINPSYIKDNPTNNLYDADGTGATPLFARDAYKLNLNYFDDGTYTDYRPIAVPAGYIQGNALPNAAQNDLYNGNISSMAVNIRKLAAQAAAGAAYAGPMLYNYQYDQINRLLSMDAWAANDSFATTGTGPMLDYSERFGYDPNGNIMSLIRHGTTGNGGSLAMDSLIYRYKYVKADLTLGEYIPGQAPTTNVDHLTNQLSSILDGVNPANYPNDIENQNANNYKYDAIGNLVADSQNHITNVTWSLYGKILSVTNAGGTTTYTYDVAGNRISKTAGGITTWYVRDATGNVMAVYTQGDATKNSGAITQSEVHLYGNSRLGILNCNINCTNLAIPAINVFTRAGKLFELSNHLGNVLATISDKKLQYSKDSVTVAYYNPDVITANDYYAFGSQMPGRTYTASSAYRYGFNGKEKSDEINGSGVDYDYGFRMYDARIGKFLSIDPLTNKYPWYTPYQFAGNTPIQAIDIDGEEPLKMAYKFADNPNPQLNLFHSDNIVDMAWAPNPTSFNSLGWGRQRQYFWRKFQHTPLGKTSLSEANLKNINGRKFKSPVVDEQWNSVMEQFGNDGILDEVIHHHHLNKGRSASPIPKSWHVGEQAEEAMHNMRFRAGRVSQTVGKNLSKSLIYLDILSVLQDSPNSILYTFHQIGTLKPNRAYPTNDQNSAPYYEWKWTGKPNESLREVTFYNDYDYRQGQWRGVGQVGEKRLYDKDGKEVHML